MEKTVIICDSTCDLSLEQEAQLGVRIVNCMVEVQGLPYEERVEINGSMVYEAVQKNGVLPKSAQVRVIDFIDAFTKAARDGYTDIICLTMNARGSGTHSSAVHAAALLETEYPMLKGKVHIHIIDTGTYALAFGGPVAYAAERLKAKAETRTVVRWLEDYFDHQITLIGLYNLEYARKSGRLNASAAIVGDILGVKPIMTIAGENKVAAKARGDKNLIPRMVEMYMEMAQDPAGLYWIAYGDNPEQGRQLAAAMKKACGAAPRIMGPIGACVAINAGPKVLGIGFRTGSPTRVRAASEE